MMDRNNCAIYIDIKWSMEQVLDLINEKYGGERNKYNVNCDWAILDIEKNDYSWFKKRRKVDGFLYYRYIVFVESKLPDDLFSTFVRNLREFILALKEIGAKVVPACDFEEELN